MSESLPVRSSYFLSVERDFTLLQQISSIVFGAVLRNSFPSKTKKKSLNINTMLPFSLRLFRVQFVSL